MTRAVVLMLDSLGIGASADADRFGDDGADTFGHIAMACARGDADQLGERSGALVYSDICRHLAWCMPQRTAVVNGQMVCLSSPRSAPGVMRSNQVEEKTPPVVTGKWRGCR